MRNGYEYEVVESCLNSEQPFLSPIAWSGKNRIPGKPGGTGPDYERKDRPIYTTCACCPETVTGEWIEERNKKHRKRNR